MSWRAWEPASACAPGLVRALGCAVQNLQQDPPAICLVWSLDPDYGLVSTVVWPRKDFQKAITSMLKVSWARVLPQSPVLGTYSWSLRQQQFGKGRNSLRIDSGNLKLVSTSLSPHTLSYGFVPARRALTCIGHIWKLGLCFSSSQRNFRKDVAEVVLVRLLYMQALAGFGFVIRLQH